MSLMNMNCPNCRGKVEVDECREFATCLYCGTKVLLNHGVPQSAPPINDPFAPQKTPYRSNSSSQQTDSFGTNVRQTTPYQTTSTTHAQGKKKRNMISAVIAIVVIVIVAVSFISSVLGRDERVISSATFISVAQKAGYDMIIEDDYDGYGTYWAGAHKFAEGVVKKEGNQIYVIDYTDDTSVHNAKVEYDSYVGEVKSIGGTASYGSGSNYEYQINSGLTQFGIAYRIDTINLYVVAPIAYKLEIISFFDALGFGVDVKA